MPPHLVCCIVMQFCTSCVAAVVAITVGGAIPPVVNMHGTHQQQLASESPPCAGAVTKGASILVAQGTNILDIKSTTTYGLHPTTT